MEPLIYLFSLLSCSNENLVKDIHLRRNMDREGWVSVHLIAGFNKVSCLQDIVISLMFEFWQTSMVNTPSVPGKMTPWAARDFMLFYFVC